MTDALRRYLEYYRDLGIRNLYVTGYATSKLPQAHEAAAAAAAAGAAESAAPVAAPPVAAVVPPRAAGPDLGFAPAAPAPAAPALPEPVETLDDIRADIGECTRCRLHQGRNKLVFGVGNPEAKLVFVGEGPGADEDEQGIPFVGRAGQLLTAMIENTAAKEGIPIRRGDVYICALGGTAAKALTGRKEGVTRMRGNWFKWRGIPMMVTYHPSYLLRPYNQNAKREAWEDLKKVLHLAYD